MHRSLLICIAALVGLSACASKSPTGGARVSTQSVGNASMGRVAVTSVVEADLITVHHDADAVYRVLSAAFDSLGIPITGLDPARKMVSNNGFKVRNRLGKMPLSTYLDCGNSQIGPNADSYDVYLSVSSTVTSGGAGISKLATLVEAQARPATYNQAYNVCSTKGSLEQKLADIVVKRLAK